LPVPGPGRDTRYRPEYNEQARKLCLLGYIDAELAEFFGVCEATLNNWKSQFPAFLESIRAGKAVADAEVADSLYRRATGEEVVVEKAIKNPDGSYEAMRLKQFVPGDVTAQRLWLLNRRKVSWRDKVEHEGTIAHTVALDAGSLSPALHFLAEHSAGAEGGPDAAPSEVV
jgi:hypothetical protein